MDVYNLVTKRAFAYENAVVEWVDANIGSKATMKYPSGYLLGRGTRAEILFVAFGQGPAPGHRRQGNPPRIGHHQPDNVKSVCKDGGRTSYRGLLHVAKGAKRVKC